MRVFSSILALILLVLLSPLLGLVSLLIFIVDGGPIFYTQERIGKDRKPFKIYKFRTMVVNADELKEDMWDENEAEYPFFKIKNDSRITTTGKLWRKTSIDELPQLVNILKGEMSFVGVRPVLKNEADYLSDERFLHNPGVTGPLQILRGVRLDIDTVNKYEIEYSMNKNIFGDLKIVLKTFPVIFKGE